MGGGGGDAMKYVWVGVLVQMRWKFGMRIWC